MPEIATEEEKALISEKQGIGHSGISIPIQCPISPPRMPFATAEQGAAGRAKARERRAQWAATLRSDFHPDDEREWAELAAADGVRLPPYGIPCAPGKMRSWLARLGISVEQYLGWEGSKRLADFSLRNSTAPLKFWVGLILEAKSTGHLGGVGR